MRAADPQPYTVTISPTGVTALDQALKDASQLESLREKAPVSPFALVSRAKQDIERFQTVLQGFGYYKGNVQIEIAGRRVDDTELVNALNTTPEGTSVEAAVTIEKGPLYHFRNIAIEGPVPSDARALLGLAPGQPAEASEALAAGVRLQTGLQEQGYAFAKVDPPIATEDPESETLDLTFKAEPGARVDIGDISLAGLRSVDEDFVRRRLLVHPGQLYQPSKIEEARRDLAAVEAFSGVSVRAAEEASAEGKVPITFDFEERPKNALSATGSYSTDLGGMVRGTWSDRNLFGRAEQLNLSATISGLGGTATGDIGYALTAQLLKPDFLRRDQALEFTASALQQDLDAYDQTAFILGTALRRKFSQRWSGSIGLTGTREKITQQDVTSYYTLLGVPLTAKYDSTDLPDLLQDATRGVRAAFTVTPTQSFGANGNPFVILQASGSTYVDVSHWASAPAGRSVIAMRGLVGSIQGASQFDVPPDQRFYGGGSATARGYKYQSIGPLFPDNHPIGGLAIDAATFEYRQRLFGDFGAVAFVDAAQVSEHSRPFSGPLRVGVGAGARYYTSFGPIRLDFAVPVNRPPGGDAFEIYIGIGQAF